MLLQIARVSHWGTQRGLKKGMPMRKPERMARMTPTILNCGGSVTSFAAAEVVASAVAETVAETVLLEVDIGSKQVQGSRFRRTGRTCPCIALFVLLYCFSREPAGLKSPRVNDPVTPRSLPIPWDPFSSGAHLTYRADHVL